jgi:hypothetical protein
MESPSPLYQAEFRNFHSLLKVLFPLIISAPNDNGQDVAHSIYATRSITKPSLLHICTASASKPNKQPTNGRNTIHTIALPFILGNVFTYTHTCTRICVIMRGDATTQISLEPRRTIPIILLRTSMLAAKYHHFHHHPSPASSSSRPYTYACAWLHQQ